MNTQEIKTFLTEKIKQLNSVKDISNLAPSNEIAIDVLARKAAVKILEEVLSIIINPISNNNSKDLFN